MKYKILILFIILDVNAKVINDTSLIQSQDLLLNSGSYEVNKTKIKLTTLKGNYFFFKDNKLNPYINGGIGYYKIAKDKVYNKYLIGGAGLRYIFSKDLNIKLGYNATFLLNSKEKLNSYYSSINYKKHLRKFNPYINATLKYNIINSSHIKGIDTNLELGLYTHKIASFLNYPLYAKVYGGISSFDNSISKILNENRVYSYGANLFWNVGKYFKYKKMKNLNIKLNLQKSIGNKSLKGSKVGVGISFIKF